MKFNLINECIELLTESFKDVVKKYKLSPEDVESIKSFYIPNPHLSEDRFLNKYGEWIHSNAGGDDAELIDKWERYRLGDISTMTLDDVRQRIETYENESARRKEKHTKKDVKKKMSEEDENVEVLADNEYYTLRWIKTYAGSVKYGNRERWCISNPSHRNYWDGYRTAGKRYCFVNFKGLDKVTEFYNKITGVEPLPEDEAQRLLFFIRTVDKTDKPSHYKKIPDAQLLAQIEKYRTTEHPDGQRQYKNTYNSFERQYNDIQNFTPSNYQKMAIEWAPEDDQNVTNENPMEYTSVWNYPNHKNVKKAYLITNAILNDLPERLQTRITNNMVEDFK